MMTPRLPLLGFPWALPAIYLQTLYVYCRRAWMILLVFGCVPC